jgi:lysozyme
MTNGIDVSNNNGHVDWAAAAKSGVKYAVAKVTEGLGFVDSFYEQNRAGAEAHGLKFGGYHFFTPGEDAAAQARFFLDHAKPRKGEIVPALDYERPPAARGPAEQFVQAVHKAIGHYPMFYTFLSFVQEMRIPASSPLAQCELWLADFTSVRPAPPAPWKTITIWQHSSSGSVPGIGGRVDLDTGTPPTDAPPKRVWPHPDHWTLAYTDVAGHRQAIETDHPGLWQSRHRRARDRGPVLINPIFHPRKK